MAIHRWRAVIDFYADEDLQAPHYPGGSDLPEPDYGDVWDGYHRQREYEEAEHLLTQEHRRADTRAPASVLSTLCYRPRTRQNSSVRSTAPSSPPLGAPKGRYERVNWQLSDRADPVTRKIADRHYNRQKIGTPQFVPPGRCLVLRAEGAFWITSWPFAEYVKHAWPGAWTNSAFRNERRDLYLSSDLIRGGVAATLHEWPDVPDLGMVTFVDASKTRRKRDPGRCYRRAGFRHVGFTKSGLWAFQLLPAEMPKASPAINSGWGLFPLAAGRTATGEDTGA